MRPYFETIHSLDIPTVEGALLRVFTKGTKHPRIMRLARWMFCDTMDESVDRLPPDMAQLTFDQLKAYLYDVPELYDAPPPLDAEERPTELYAVLEKAIGAIDEYGGDDDDELAELLERALEMQFELDKEQEAKEQEELQDEEKAALHREAQATAAMERVDRTTFMGLKEQGGVQGPWEHWPVPEVLRPSGPIEAHAWLATLWARINFGPLLIRYLERSSRAYAPFVRAKMKQFQEHHLQVVQWIHATGTQEDVHFVAQWDECPLYTPLGHSPYPDDRSHIQATATRVQRKARPLEILIRRFPHIEWDPWDVARALREHWSDEALWDLWGIRPDDPKTEKAPHDVVSEAGPYRITYHPLRYRMTDVEAIRGHSLYLACCMIVSRCQSLEEGLRADQLDAMAQRSSSSEEGDAVGYDEQLDAVCDALYMYRVAFLDLFYGCLSQGPYVRMDDRYLLTPLSETRSLHGKKNRATGLDLSPWEYWYPHDTRGFHADDLPNLFSVILHIPLSGISRTPSPPIFHILLKCMPFACMKRGLVKEVIDLCRDEPTLSDEALQQQSRSQRQRSRRFAKIRYCENEGFWRLFRHVMWCMLAGTYPGSRGRPGMRKLLRIKQLCENRDMLMDTLSLQSQQEQIKAKMRGEQRKSALKRLGDEQHANNDIIITAFRAYYFHLVMDQPQYTGPANACVDLPHLFQETHRTMVIIRNSNLFLEDAFAMARSAFKNNNVVYRYHQDTCARMMIDECNTYMEDTLYVGIPNYTRDLDHLAKMREACQAYLNVPWDNPGDRETFIIGSQNDCDDSVSSAYDVVCMADGHEYGYRFVHIKERLAEIRKQSGVKKRLCRRTGAQHLKTALESIQETLSVIAEVEQHRTLGLQHMRRELTLEVKGNILNLMARVPRDERLTQHAFCALRFTRYGGISKETALIMERLVRIYDENPVPKVSLSCFF